VKDDPEKQLRLDDMPVAELQVLAGQLMVPASASAERTELAGAIRRRLELIDRLDREALLDIVVWAHRPVSRSADKLELVREISQIKFTAYDGLSFAGLLALAQLKGLTIPEAVTDDQLRSMLRRCDGLSGWLARKRRAAVGVLLGKLLDAEGPDDRYQFLPDSDSDASLRKQIEQQGVVGGLASKIKVGADRYIDTKLDEIERRIDRKLDEIDQRLAEWRDREIANRLRIVKITLIGSIIIAVVSLLYSYLRYKM